MEEEEKQNPGLTGSIPPVVAPFGAAASADGAGEAQAAKPAPTIRLKPVIRRPMIRKPGSPAPASPAPAPAPANPVQAAKSATGALKGVTGPIPAQAVLKKTGIIAEGGVAEGILTPAQAQAAKSKTSRISLESAMGVAPVAPSPAPMKTIRLRRPTDLKPAAPKIVPSAAPSAETAAAPAVEDIPAVADLEPISPAEIAPAAAPDATITQKKTLKLHRPGVSLKRPSMNVGAAPAANISSDVPDIADIPDLPGVGAQDAGKAPVAAGKPASGVFAAITSVAAVAALAVLGFCTFKLYTEATGAGAIANGIVSSVGY